MNFNQRNNWELKSISPEPQHEQEEQQQREQFERRKTSRSSQ